MKTILATMLAILAAAPVCPQEKPKPTAYQASIQKIIFEQSKLIADLTIRIHILEQRVQIVETLEQQKAAIAQEGTVYVNCESSEREIHSSYSYVAPTVAKVACGTALTSLGNQSGYVKVKTSAGIIGYIMEDYVSSARIPPKADLSQVKADLTKFQSGGCDSDMNKAFMYGAVTKRGLEPAGAMGAAMNCTQRLAKIVQQVISLLDEQQPQ